MHVSYGRFGAVTPVPGVYKITIFLTVGREYGIVGTPIYDSAVSVPEIRWGALKNNLPSAVVAFPPGARVPGTVSVSAQKMPVPGEVVQLPGLSGTEAPPPPPPTFAPVVTSASAPIVTPMPPPPPALAPVLAPPPMFAPVPPPASPLPPELAPVPSVPQAIPTGQATTLDLPATGPTSVPVYVAPVSKPEIVPGAGGRLVVVVPRDQLPNLPTMPIRQAVGPRGADSAIQYSPEMWATYFTFPPRTRVPLYADPVREVASPAGTAASPAIPGVRDVSTAVGPTDAEGRKYPVVQDVGTQASAVTGTPDDATMVVGDKAPPEKSKLPWGLLAVVAAGVYFVGRK